jgi:hypothetical protein
MANPAVPFLLGWFRELRLPTLTLLTAGLFLLDLIVPDLIPFIDELLLGLLTLVFASWKKRKAAAPPLPPPGG